MSGQDVLEGLQLVGGRPSLDFINTEGDVRNGPPERIPSYESLVDWSRLVGVIDPATADRLGGRGPGRGTIAVLERAVRLRESLYRIFAATLAGETPSDRDRSVFDMELAEALRHRRLVRDGDAWRWEFGSEGDDAMLWRLAHDAADLLTSPELDRVRLCDGTDCTWLFVDRSRNRSRRWCDMAECGNRSKARRFYRRQKADG